LNRFISENHKNCDLDHMQVQPHQQRALRGRPLAATHQIPLVFVFFHSRQMSVVLSLESGSGMVLDLSEMGTDVAMF
jgi:hypothetical protein